MEVLQQLGTYYSQNGGYVLQEFYRHFLMSVYGVLFAAIVGIPLGILSQIQKIKRMGFCGHERHSDDPGSRHARRADACHGAGR